LDRKNEPVQATEFYNSTGGGELKKGFKDKRKRNLVAAGLQLRTLGKYRKKLTRQKGGQSEIGWEWSSCNNCDGSGQCGRKGVMEEPPARWNQESISVNP